MHIVYVFYYQQQINNIFTQTHTHKPQIKRLSLLQFLLTPTHWIISY